MRQHAASHPRPIYLTTTHRIVWGQRADWYDRLVDVGTFDKRVTLADFREAVFFAWDNRGRG